MAIQFIAAGTSAAVTQGSTGSPAPGLPAGVADGDLLELWVNSRDNITHSLNAGWTQAYQGSNGASTQQSLWYARYKATSPNTGSGQVNSATVTHSGTGAIVARMTARRYAYPTGSPYGTIGSMHATGTAVSTPGITATYSGSQFVHYFGGGTGNTANALSAASGYTVADLATSSSASNASGRAQLGAYYSATLSTASSAGPTGAVTCSVAPTTATGYGALIVEVRADPNAPPTFVAAGSTGLPSFATNPGIPAGIANNDILLMAFQSRDNATHSIATNGTGWTKFFDSAPNATLRLSLWWKRSTGTESAPVMATTGLTDGSSNYIVAFRGCTTGGTPYDVLGSGVYNATGTVSLSVESVTTTQGNDNVAAFAVYSSATPNLLSATGATTTTFGAGFGNGNGLGIGASGAYGAVSATGATATSTLNLDTIPGSTPVQTIALALKNNASTPVTASFTGSGGIVVGGSATRTAKAVWTSSGGVVCGGSATVSSNYPQHVVITGAGGCVLGGAALEARKLAVKSSGGIVLGGSATAATGHIDIAPTYVATGASGQIGNGYAIAPAIPAGLAANDVLIMSVQSRDNGAHTILTNGSGWTQFFDYKPTATLHHSLWWKRSSGTESAPTFDSTVLDGGSTAYISAFRGCRKTGSPIDVAGTGANSTYSASPISVAGVTTGHAQDMVVAYFAGAETSAPTNLLSASGACTATFGGGFGTGLGLGIIASGAYGAAATVGATATATLNTDAITAGTVISSVAIALFNDSSTTASAAYVAQGGAVLGGSAAIARKKVVTATGGAVLGGAALEARRVTISAAGGIVLGGTATARISKALAVSGAGGFVVGGGAGIVRKAAFTSAGGVVLGGNAGIAIVRLSTRQWMPRLQIGAPIVGTGTPSLLNDGQYRASYAWTCGNGSYAALDLGYNASRTQILVCLSQEDFSSGDFTNAGVPNITLKTSTDSTNGVNGTWVTYSTSSWPYLYFSKVLPFTGCRWVRLEIGGSIASIDELEVWDCTSGLDAWGFFGDSITNRATKRGNQAGVGNQPSFQADINTAFGQYPMQIGAGVIGQGATYIDSVISTWLTAFPMVKNALISIGTNDAAAGSANIPAFTASLNSIVSKCKAAGVVPQIARIPWTADGAYGGGTFGSDNTSLYNAAIDGVKASQGLTAGPDLYTYSHTNSAVWYNAADGGDGVHPGTAGCVAWNQLWATAVAPNFTNQNVHVNGSGGAVIGGSAAVTRRQTVRSVGGVVVGGAAAQARRAVVASAGGAVLGGSTTIAARSVARSTGGVVLGGSSPAAVGKVRSYVAQGGAVLGGAALESRHVSVTGRGGFVVGGNLIGPQQLSITGFGGAVLGGSATIAARSVARSTGGAVLGGSAPQSRSVAARGSGGAVLGGSATVSRRQVVRAAGGVVVGGSAQYRVIVRPIAGGGIVVGGSATEARRAVYAASGGCVLGGAAAITTSAGGATHASFTGSGGLLVGGAALQTRGVAVSSAGGCVLGGAALVAATSAAAPLHIDSGVVSLDMLSAAIATLDTLAAGTIRLEILQ